jgi:hypothetical protein
MPALQATDLSKVYGSGEASVHALDRVDVSFDAGPLLGGGWRVRARLPLAAQATRAAAA